MRIVAATTDEEMLHTIIGAQILGGTIPRPVCETGQWADLPAACGEVYCRRKAPVTV